MKKVPVTISGSLPKPEWLAESGKLWGKWKSSGEELLQAKAKALKLIVEDQLNSGLTIITDGEQTREHFVTTFIENISGVDFKNKKTVRIRNRYDAQVPVVTGEVQIKKSLFLEDVKILRKLTDKPIKISLPGPLTMVDTLYDDYYKSRQKLAEKFAEILNWECLQLEKAGIDIIQFDEPAFNVFFDEVKDWGVATLEKAAKNLKVKTAVHICYGYGIEANIKWKQSLGNEWRQYEHVFPLLAKSKINQVSLECMNSKVPLDLIGLLKGKDIMAGVIDVATKEIENPKNILELIKKVLKFTKLENLILCTNCGMVTFSREVALSKMKSMAEAATLISKELK